MQPLRQLLSSVQGGIREIEEEISLLLLLRHSRLQLWQLLLWISRGRRRRHHRQRLVELIQDTRTMQQGHRLGQ
jgi:hypothetical protein